MGRTVLENLEEGENFILQTSEHTLRVTKQRGRAVVTIMKLPLMLFSNLLSKPPHLHYEDSICESRC
jgi:hypothetical protein